MKKYLFYGQEVIGHASRISLFQLAGKRKIFRESRDPESPWDSGNSRVNFPELDYFDIFYDFQHCRSNF